MSLGQLCEGFIKEYTYLTSAFGRNAKFGRLFYASHF